MHDVRDMERIAANRCPCVQRRTKIQCRYSYEHLGKHSFQDTAAFDYKPRPSPEYPWMAARVGLDGELKSIRWWPTRKAAMTCALVLADPDYVVGKWSPE